MEKSRRQTGFRNKYRFRLRRANDLLSLISAFLLIFFLQGDQSAWARKNQVMAAEIRLMALAQGLQTGSYFIDPDVLRAMAQVPRHLFISPALKPYAYMNVALPLADQNYILPEPFLTARMIDLLDLAPGEKVLDIGYGAGYDAAIMSRLGAQAYILQQKGQVFDKSHMAPLEKRGYTHIQTRSGDDLRRWKDKAPFDAILVRGALPFPPRVLLDQLNVGGRLVIPIGRPGEPQTLRVYTRTADGTIKSKTALHLKIAPLYIGYQI